MPFTLCDPLAHRAAEIFVTIVAYTELGIRRDIGRIDDSRGRIYRQPAGKRRVTGSGGMTAGTIRELGEISASGHQIPILCLNGGSNHEQDDTGTLGGLISRPANPIH